MNGQDAMQQPTEREIAEHQTMNHVKSVATIAKDIIIHGGKSPAEAVQIAEEFITVMDALHEAKVAELDAKHPVSEPAPVSEAPVSEVPQCG